METHRLLATYTAVVQRFGPDSDEAAAFRDEHYRRHEFQSLADVVDLLIDTLSPVGDD